jgi:threonylcarbamoyladenosine tRNA methylthiotransferase MtaB
MKTFTINTLGCKVNQYESQQIRELLERYGLKNAPKNKVPDLFVVNTCCITHIASSKSRQYIKKALKRNSNAVIVVTGCLPKVNTDELQIPSNNVHIIPDFNNLINALENIRDKNLNDPGKLQTNNTVNNKIKPKTHNKIKHKNILSSYSGLTSLTQFKGHTRAFLKIQDGCDAYCTYCIIPKTRPYIYSRKMPDVLKEAKNLIHAGHKEIVLTGIFLGAYAKHTVRRKKWGNKINYELIELVDKLAQINGLYRLRLSSLSPMDISEQLMKVFQNHSNIMPHLHLSLQSGSDRILKKMCRQYTADDFLQKIRLIKDTLDRPAITTDIIVGFPGETDEDFEKTFEIAQKATFSKIHVFPYSQRKHTPAEKLPNKIKSSVKKRRSQLLQTLSDEMASNFRKKFIGEYAQVLVEKDTTATSGLSERYFQVSLQNNGFIVKKNDIITVKLTQNTDKYAIGLTVAKN